MCLLGVPAPDCLQVEARFRFLAADSTATIRGKRPSYRESLLLVRDRCVCSCVNS